MICVNALNDSAADLFLRETYHPAFRALAEMRLRLARRQQRTLFNLLGPLLNPARPKRQLIGVFFSAPDNAVRRCPAANSIASAPG